MHRRHNCWLAISSFSVKSAISTHFPALVQHLTLLVYIVVLSYRASCGAAPRSWSPPWRWSWKTGRSRCARPSSSFCCRQAFHGSSRRQVVKALSRPTSQSIWSRGPFLCGVFMKWPVSTWNNLFVKRPLHDKGQDFLGHPVMPRTAKQRAVAVRDQKKEYQTPLLPSLHHFHAVSTFIFCVTTHK